MRSKHVEPITSSRTLYRSRRRFCHRERTALLRLAQLNPLHQVLIGNLGGIHGIEVVENVHFFFQKDTVICFVEGMRFEKPS